MTTVPQASGSDGTIDSEEIATEGIEGHWPLSFRDRVRFAEIDMFGHANHAAYLEWFENARSKYFPAYDLTDFGPGSNRPVMRSLSVDYFRPLRLGDTYVVTAKTTEIGRTSFSMAFEIWSAGQRAASCTTAFVLLSSRTGKPTPIPQDARARMERDCQ